MRTCALQVILAAGVLCLGVVSGADVPPTERATPKPIWVKAHRPFPEWLAACRKAYDEINAYRCQLTRRHRLDGELTEAQTSKLRFHKPFCVRMDVVSGPRAGTRLLYVAGKNGNCIRARGVGILSLKAMNLEADSALAMAGELHPITSVGIEKVLEIMEQQLALMEEDRVEPRVEGAETKRDGRKLIRFDLEMPNGKSVKKGRYFCHRAVVTFDVKKRLPIEARLYEDGRLREEYFYRDLELDPKLPASDFDLDDI